jgi:hypothetical protein
VCATTPYLCSAKTCTITMGSFTSPHVLRFTPVFRPQARAAAAWSKPSSHQRCGDGEVSHSGSGVIEAVCESPTFTEWSTTVVPTYPEGGSQALQVCQHHHHRLCESASLLSAYLSGCQGLKEHVARDCTGRFG